MVLNDWRIVHRKAVKEQLKSLGVNDQIKNLVAEKRIHTQVKEKDSGITKEQAVAELKVCYHIHIKRDWPVQAAFGLTAFCALLHSGSRGN